jgi:hypothetical protein
VYKQLKNNFFKNGGQEGKTGIIWIGTSGRRRI